MVNVLIHLWSINHKWSIKHPVRSQKFEQIQANWRNLLERGIDNFPCVSHSGKRMDAGPPSPAASSHTLCSPLNAIWTRNPQEAKGRLFLSPSNKCFMQISKFSANFPWKGRRGPAVRGEERGPRRPDPGSGRFLAPGFLRPLAGPAWCQKLALSPVSGCWFYLSSVSWICKNSWGLVFCCFFFLSGGCLHVQKPVYLCWGGRTKYKCGEKRRIKKKRKRKARENKKERKRERKKFFSRYCWAGGFLPGPVLLLEHVIVRQRSTSFTSFFHYSK